MHSKIKSAARLTLRVARFILHRIWIIHYYKFIIYETLSENLPEFKPKIPVTVYRFPHEQGYYFKAYYNGKLIHYRHTTIELHRRHKYFSPKWMQYQGIFDTDTWTDPEYRRNGVSLYVFYLISQYWKPLGIYRFLEIIQDNNTAQIAAKVKTRSIPLGIAKEFRIGKLAIYWKTRELKEAYKQMEKRVNLEPWRVV